MMAGLTQNEIIDADAPDLRNPRSRRSSVFLRVGVGAGAVFED